MNVLPQHIEGYLTDAGFSATEILVLKHLMDGASLSLRELAVKTGKSTGVLDQATKKLLRKKLLERTACNGSPKLALVSLDALATWVQTDLQQRWQLLRRKEEDFETYIASVQRGKSQPTIEYYEGVEGLRKVYLALFDAGAELLRYFPFSSLHAEGENPLRGIRPELLRERRRRGVFSRVITHDTPHGRRYRSRDPFEYRRTLLVPEQEYRLPFEKIIAGDLICCIDRSSRRASLIRYPELAQAERHTFEVLWGILSCREKDRAPCRCAGADALSGEAPQPPRRSVARALAAAPARMRDFFKLCGIIPRAQASGERSLKLDLEVLTKDRAGLVHDVTCPFALRNINLTKLIVFAIPPDELLVELQCEARDGEELGYVLRELERTPSVIGVRSKDPAGRRSSPESSFRVPPLPVCAGA